MKIEDWSSQLKQKIQQPIISVMVIEDIQNAIPLAKALVEGGLNCLEITLRTDAALEAIYQISQEVEDAIVGAGTLINSKNVEAASKAGATFGVSPGTSKELISICSDNCLPLLPGASTASEVLALLDEGITFAKFFPAESAGGANFIKSISGPLPQMTFCPTGGINLQNASSYLKLENVLCVGGSWVTPSSMIKNQEWDKISELARSSIASVTNI
jgi:2-dehydro-3-deoxyphosphogluconate aldolase/(4S)-4-hydroxy-2-oxoglutarate aldolase